MTRDLGSPVVDADVLLAPNLRTFGWSFSIEDQHSEDWTDFGDKEANWLREFARTAITRKAALNRIEVEFNPDDWEAWRRDDYPWDRMDKIRDEVRPHGIALDYGIPPLTKEEWLKEKTTRGDDEEELLLDHEEESVQGSTTSEPSDAESTYPALDDPNPGRDIREYFSLVQTGT